MSLGGHIDPCESKSRSETEFLNVCPGSTFMFFNFSTIFNVDYGPLEVCMPPILTCDAEMGIPNVVATDETPVA